MTLFEILPKGIKPVNHPSFGTVGVKERAPTTGEAAPPPDGQGRDASRAEEGAGRGAGAFCDPRRPDPLPQRRRRCERRPHVNLTVLLAHVRPTASLDAKLAWQLDRSGRRLQHSVILS